MGARRAVRAVQRNELNRQLPELVGAGDARRRGPEHTETAAG